MSQLFSGCLASLFLAFSLSAIVIDLPAFNPNQNLKARYGLMPKDTNADQAISTIATAASTVCTLAVGLTSFHLDVAWAVIVLIGIFIGHKNKSKLLLTGFGKVDYVFSFSKT